ncbi:PREDICTED: trefoil factor 1 isoform X2 [Chinchilla lanigera]|uniref:trefoil factor 1 isoform X2 n=1 Tax=Chinchilla lanigera TaxID=34839 RepID=UPI000696E6F7|nr:PREDICTED: trefoil factor 1 isoform X2 [Chinchilla lanigera]
MERKVTCVLAVVLMLVFGTLAGAQTETCEVAPHERSNCGFNGITRKECEAKGCCFSDTFRGVPWCFHKQQVPVEEEEECVF